MFDYDRLYELRLVLGSPSAVPLWNWQEWRGVAQVLDPLMRTSRGKTTIRSAQFLDGIKHPVLFGRMGWSDKSHQKWTHESPVNSPASTHWKFLDMEAWAPSWTLCEKQGRPPDVFFAMRNECFNPPYRSTFNPTVLLAIAHDLPQQMKNEADQVGAKLSHDLRATLYAFQVRPWGLPFGSGGDLHTGLVSDLLTVGLFRVGPIHETEPSLQVLSETWETR